MDVKDVVQQVVGVAYKRAGSYQALQDATGVPKGQITAYRAGAQLPSMPKFMAMLRFVGGRVVVKEDAPTPGVVRMKPVAGRVTAGGVDFAGHDDGEVPVPDDVWRGSALWSGTHGDVVLLRVQGDSMQPRYHNGDLIACRAPATCPAAGTPVILRDDGSFTFKLFSLSHDKRHVVGLPLNPAYPPVVLPARETTQVQYVVLGALNLGR